MRPRHLILTATGLLILCCTLIIGRSGKDRENKGTKMVDSDTVHKVDKTASNSINFPRDVAATDIQPTRNIPGENNHTTQKPSGAKVGQPANTVKRGAKNDPARVVADGQAAQNLDDIAGDVAPRPNATSSTPKSGSVPKGIRLADSVKLPAVILAINAAEKDTQTKIPAPVAAAMHGIVDSFYRDLADSAEKGDPDTNPEASGAESGTKDTVVIHPSPEVELAREKANETYRALFGDAAYDQMTMRALMEAQLPAGPVTGGN